MLNAYLCIYATMYDAFAQIDGGGQRSSVGAGLEAAKAAKKSKGGNKKVTNDQLIAIMAEGLDEEAKIVDVPEVKKDRRIDMAEFLEGYGRVTGYNFVAFSGIKVNGCWGPGCGAATIIFARASEG
jgi:hypothetical protein